jgi:hypothetical protein
MGVCPSSVRGTATGVQWLSTSAAPMVFASGSLTDPQRSRPVSTECTQLVELRPLGSTGSSAEGALGDGPEPDELADFGSAVIPGRRTSRPKSFFVADGGSQCPEGRCCAAGSARSCGEAGCSSARRSRVRLPWGSLAFLEASVEIAGRWDIARTCGIPAGQRPVALVGVTGFEPAASSSRAKRKSG